MSGDNTPVPSGRPDAKLLAQFVENQTKELEHRAQEIELEKQKDGHAFEYGKEALAAQERDRKHERECDRQKRSDRHRFILFALGLVSVLLLGAV